ncbi:hypothetical protein [Streptomyces sp. NPDC097619]|uniref:hypothetical protein n=1 Tax=Streptomyces sp. NPDC097619 TaxID=3157228 RepID=UPI00331A833A
MSTPADPGTNPDPGTDPRSGPGPGTDLSAGPGTDPGTDPGAGPGTDPGIGRGPVLGRPRVSLRAQVAAATEEADRLVADGLWDVAAEDADLAHRAAGSLATVIGPPDYQEMLPGLARLEHLREALAVLALATARTHGHLAWLLAATSHALTPVLQWRALTADPDHAFGTVLPTTGELADAEHAIRHLHTVLARIPAHTDGTDAAGCDEPDTPP